MMTIKEFASRVGATESRIRYYEKAGILLPVARKDNGYREFRESDVAWMEFVFRLKATGMPISEVAAFARLRSAGEATVPARLRMLEKHEARILGAMEKQGRHLQAIQEKMKTYESMGKDLP